MKRTTMEIQLLEIRQSLIECKRQILSNTCISLSAVQYLNYLEVEINQRLNHLKYAKVQVRR